MSDSIERGRARGLRVGDFGPRRGRWRPWLGILLLVALPGAACSRRRPPPPDALTPDGCHAVVEASFGPQDEFVVAARPARGGSVFDPQVLAAVARVSDWLQRTATSAEVSIRTLTTVPLMRPEPSGTAIVVIGEDLPTTQGASDALRPLVYAYEFSVGDLVNTPGTITWLHLPRVDFQGQDPAALLKGMRTEVLDTLTLALDDGDPDRRLEYRQVAGGAAPSADHLEVLFQADRAGGMKDPKALRAVLEFQTLVEQHPSVAQTYSATDDIMVARRYLFRGNPGEARIPSRRAEVSQALLALQLSGNAEALGTRISSDERVVLVRVSVHPMVDPGRLGRVRTDVRRLAEAVAGRHGLHVVTCP